MAALTTSELWNLVRKAYPTFRSHTSEATGKHFTAEGFEALKQGEGIKILNEFWGLVVPFYLLTVNISHATDRLENNGFGEYYDVPWGGFIQRMSVDSVKPISPAYKGLTDGAGPDPFVVRKPKADNRFFKYNFDYQSVITIPDDFQQKQLFTSTYGLSEFLAGVYEGLRNGYVIQRYENKLECFNSAFHSTNWPMQDSQTVEVSISDEPTNDELVNFQIAIMDTVSLMTIGPQTDSFNSYHFASTQDESRLKLLVRPGWKNRLKARVLANAFNRDDLTVPVDIIEVPHFGGLQYYKEAAFTTPLKDVYDELGAHIGFSEDGTTSGMIEDADKANLYIKDPNEDVYAVLADKGFLFECRQNPYTVEPIRNPRGLYTNQWASSPNNAVAWDPLYNMVVFKKTP